jgi:putative membrane protein
MEAQTDQMIGGLTMWIPAALTEVIGMMMALRTLMRLSAKGRWGTPKPRKGSISQPAAVERKI